IDTRSFLFSRTNGLTPASNDSDRYRRVVLSYCLRQFPTTHARHTQVSEDTIELVFLKELQSGSTTVCDLHLAIFTFKNLFQQVSHKILIVNNQDFGFLDFSFLSTRAFYLIALRVWVRRIDSDDTR